MRKIRATTMSAVPRHERQALRALPPDMREVLVTKLAEILVLDYQANQPVPQATVTSLSLRDRGLRLVKPE